MSKAVETLLKSLDLEQLEINLFRGISPKVGWQRVFGGQVIGQALVAAQRTVVEDRRVHSLHGYFMRPGDPEHPIIYEVDRIRDGGSFTTRRVVAIQHGHAIFSMSASFQIHESGLEHMFGGDDRGATAKGCSRNQKRHQREGNPSHAVPPRSVDSARTETAGGPSLRLCQRPSVALRITHWPHPSCSGQTSCWRFQAESDS